MFEAQRLMDLQDNPNFGDPKSWLSGDNDNTNNISISINSSPTHLPTTHSSLAPTPSGSNVDRDRKASSSFTRRGSMIYTKTPSRESLSKKITEPKGRNATQSIPTKKRRDPVDKDHSKNASNNFDAESFSSFSSRASAAEKDREELVMLKEQVEDLQKKILEKDELLKSAEISKNQMNAVQVKLDELKQQAEEKDSLIKSTQRKLSDAKLHLGFEMGSGFWLWFVYGFQLQLQFGGGGGNDQPSMMVVLTVIQGSDQVLELSEALRESMDTWVNTSSVCGSKSLVEALEKIKLADKQAALEKIQWEAMTSNREVEKLQEDLDSVRGEISSFMLLFESLTKNDSASHTADYDITPNYLDSLSSVDNLDEMEIQRMEEATQAYIAAVAAAKDKQDEESITAAANARLHLQSLVISSERKC
ncbi:protein microtubule binding protein 2c [Quercus suber]|uniref:Protein microtubule binding protein 2c n=1 Tax=Quercus suber TaxID=58331 RepID=A0AAW0LJV2_QUESU